MCNILGLIMGWCGPNAGCRGIISTISGCGGRDGTGGGTTEGGTGGTGGLTVSGTGSTTGGVEGSGWPCGCGSLQLSTNTCPAMCEPIRCKTNIDVPNGAVFTVTKNSLGNMDVFYYNGTKIECIDENAGEYGGYPFPSD